MSSTGIYLTLLISLIIIIAAIFFWILHNQKRLTATINHAQRELLNKDQELNSLKERFNQLHSRSAQLEVIQQRQNEDAHKLSDELERRENLLDMIRKEKERILGENRELSATLTSERRRAEEILSEKNQHQKELKELNTQYRAVQVAQKEAEARLKEQLQSFEKQKKYIEEQQRAMKLEFEQLATKILSEKGEIFSKQNREGLTNLLSPLQTQMKEFREKMERIHKEELQKGAQLKTELSHLKELNQQITQEAKDLTYALKGNKKMQGNWGEIILENLLERAGLTKGRDYHTQLTLEGEDNSRQIPDVVIELPRGRHLIVDSKVSLNNFLNMINADDPDTEAHYLNLYIADIKNHIKDLAGKHYSRAKGIKSPELVVMFLPVEPAYIEAFKSDQTLFDFANRNNIMVATPSSLLASLTLIQELWRIENQSQSTEELIRLAGSVYDKVRTFLESMDEIEKGLLRATENYQKAKGQLIDGRGNLVKLTDDLVKLGVSVRKEISDDWVDPARLELERPKEREDSKELERPM